MGATKVDPTVAWMFASGLLVLMKIVCFVLGYMTVRLGHDLLKRGRTDESASTHPQG
jgi:hypothetical protein